MAAGRHACTFDLESGRALRRFESGSERSVLHSPRVEGTRDGRLLFIGNAEGDLSAYDLRCVHYECYFLGVHMVCFTSVFCLTIQRLTDRVLGQMTPSLQKCRHFGKRH